MTGRALLEQRLSFVDVGCARGCYNRHEHNRGGANSDPRPPNRHHVINPGRLRNFVLIASAVQYARAPTGPVGLYAELCGNALAPTTKTFGTSHDCRYLFTALLPGDVPMMAPPVLCVD